MKLEILVKKLIFMLSIRLYVLRMKPWNLVLEGT